MGKALFYVGCGWALCRIAQWAHVKALVGNIDVKWKRMNRE